MDEAIGYSVIIFEKGYFRTMNIPFAIRTESGHIESLSADKIDEIYCQILKVDTVDDISTFYYGRNSEYKLHISVPKKLVSHYERPLWEDIFGSELLVVTIMSEDKPQVANVDTVLDVVNTVNVMGKYIGKIMSKNEGE